MYPIEFFGGMPVLIIIIIFCCRMIDGWETLDDLEKIPVHEKTFRPTTDICIRRVTIHANPLAD